MIGAAIVERIVRAARERQPYQMIVVMPAVPAFAGDLRADDALGTRAIMEFQYDSINRGGRSIYEKLAKEGINPMDYIRFYNLRNYDRINISRALKDAEQKSGVSYEEARQEQEARWGGGYRNQEREGEGFGEQPHYTPGAADAFQRGARELGGSTRWDSVAECCMLGGTDIRDVPWESGNGDEIDAFVSEELYIHSKLLIADDRVMICGSANLNDRSQLGNHDSEIAIIISEDQPSHNGRMAGRDYPCCRVITELRREIFRKHMGLLSPQDYRRQYQNYEPVSQSPNAYEFGTSEDRQVEDPIDQAFLNTWNSIAHTNTEAFGKVFHPVPHDSVRTWEDYDTWYSQYFAEGDPKDDKKPKGKYKVGHVVKEEFPGGVAEVKEWLSRIRGNLVEMPLLFLKDVDMAVEGMSFNTFTKEVYT